MIYLKVCSEYLYGIRYRYSKRKLPIVNHELIYKNAPPYTVPQVCTTSEPVCMLHLTSVLYTRPCTGNSLPNEALEEDSPPITIALYA